MESDKKGRDVYQRLAKHLSALGMGYPEKDELIEILKENFTPEEAEIALAIPTKVIPFEPVGVPDIARHMHGPHMAPKELEHKLTLLAHRGLLFSRKMADGEMGYALQQFGYGFPQTFFWGGADTPFSRKMAQMIVKYSKREEIRKAYGETPTKAMRYVPAAQSLDPESNAVFPFEMMEQLIKKVNVIAVAHCPCRMTADLIGRRKCSHELEVCLKYDDLAEYLIDKKIGREISRQEAIEITRRCEGKGLVHLVDNAREGIRHTCNCCGCCCWSVGSIKRKTIPRDVLMATYFIRETDQEKCSACGACVDICPVKAVRLENDTCVVDTDWCIGCGVCALPCPTSAVSLVRKSDAIPPKDFKELHEMILREKTG
ncbi:MAG TPA: 4Fe-4S binding protein [Syntrophorhabdales bacterium]|nr:4Fe-4S binding protein [Syntrophorhabdales bacterium]